MITALTYKRPINLVILLNFIGYLILFFYKTPYNLNIIYSGISVIYLLKLVNFLIHKFKLGDEYIFLIISMLFSLGNIIIFRLNIDSGFRQLLWFFIGIALFLLTYITFTKINIWNKGFYAYLIIGIMIYVITLMFGKTINGSTNWIIINGYSFQLSEISKVIFLLFLSCYFSTKGKVFFNFKFLRKLRPKTINRLALATISFSNVGFLILQKEWGSAFLFFTVYLICVYVYDTNLIFLFLNILFVIPISLIGYYNVFHIKVRIDTWLNPWFDPSGKGYQIIQSLISIGSGNFFGSGIGLGKPNFVPANTTDFIFSAICEEMGTFTGVGIILLFFLFFYRGIRISLNVNDSFKKILAFGITVMFGLQTFIIIGGVIKLIPLTGITLPFLSYGGSSLITCFILLGILQAISRDNIIKEEVIIANEQ